MKFKSAIFFLVLLSMSAIAGPVLQMNKAFNALTDLVPYLTNRDKFMEKKNETLIKEKITDLNEAFKSAKHETMLKEDLFAPSYKLINENIAGSLEAFRKGNKDYAHWRLKEVTSHCLDCHTRLPPSFSSSFQNGELTIDTKKFEDLYNLAIAQLIVRRYVDAKNNFIKVIDEKIIKKEFQDLILPIKQVLLIETKIQKDPSNLKRFLKTYISKKDLPNPVRDSLTEWLERVKYWQDNKVMPQGLKSDSEVTQFIKKKLAPLEENSFNEKYDVDILLASGLLSNYLFINPSTKIAPEISYWLGWTEKHLKRGNFFGSGDLFLKQCIKRYPKSPIAQKCLDEYKESVEFDFSGSSGTNIPDDVKQELKDLEKLISKK